MNTRETMIVPQPYVIMFKPAGSDKIHTHIHRGDDNLGYEGFGLLICDLLRHVANAFDVDEEDVWEWVERERRKPTGNLQRME